MVLIVVMLHESSVNASYAVSNDGLYYKCLPKKSILGCRLGIIFFSNSICGLTHGQVQRVSSCHLGMDSVHWSELWVLYIQNNLLSHQYRGVSMVICQTAECSKQ